MERDKRRTVTSLQALLKAWPTSERDALPSASTPSRRGGRGQQQPRRVSIMDASTFSPLSSTPSRSPRPSPRRSPSTPVRDDLDDHVDRVLQQAGTVSSPRTGEQIPLIVIAPCNLPAKGAEAVVDRLLDRMEPFVQSEYAVILLASPSSPVSLSTSFLISRYLRLPYSMRKNVAAIYITHASVFTKVVIRVLSGIVSPKTITKTRTVSSLTELATCLDITQINVPPGVYEHNLKIEPSIQLRKPGPRQFGVALDKLMGAEGQHGLPRVVRDCLALLSKPDSLAQQGIFRVSPSSSVLRTVREAYDRGHPVRLEDYDGDVHLAASLLKSFFRSLPEPIFPSSAYTLFERCPPPCFETTSDAHAANLDALDYFRTRVIPSMAPPEARLFTSFLDLCHLVAQHADVNKMDAHNLAICVVPVLIRSADLARDGRICAVNSAGSLGVLLKVLIARYPDGLDVSAPTTPTLSASQESLSDTSSPATVTRPKAMRMRTGSTSGGSMATSGKATLRLMRRSSPSRVALPAQASPSIAAGVFQE